MKSLKPKTFKLVIKGEIVRLIEEHTFADGTKAVIEKRDKVPVPSKKNNVRMAVNKATLQVIPIPSIQHEKWDKAHIQVFRNAANSMAEQGFSLPITRAKIKVLFYFADSRDRDLSNKFETIADIMVDAGILADDRYKVLKPVYLDGWTNRAKPRTEIYLTLITGDMPEHAWDITPPEHELKLKERKHLLRQVRISKQKQGLL
jgi:Holliday junction resolvase RusA-like endonuclease